MASVAASLHLYAPDLDAVNPGVNASQLQQGDLLRLPPWDPQACGVLPATLEELTNTPPPPSPPPPAPAKGPSKPGASASPVQASPPSPDAPQGLPPPSILSPPPQKIGVPMQQAPPPGPQEPGPAATDCQGYQMVASDTLFSVAAMFGVDISALMAANPDLANGAPTGAGTIVKIPPYDATCSHPNLIPNPATVPPPPPSGPVGRTVMPNATAPAATAPASDTPTSDNSPPTLPDFPQYVPDPTAAVEPYDGPAAGTLNSNGTPASGGIPATTNVVSDAASGYPAPPPPKHVNAGIFITAACIFFAVIGIFGESKAGGPVLVGQSSMLNAYLSHKHRAI